MNVNNMLFRALLSVYVVLVCCITTSNAQMKVDVTWHPFTSRTYGYLVANVVCTNTHNDTIILLMSYHDDVIGREYHQLYYHEDRLPVRWWYGSPYIVSLKKELAPNESYAAQVDFSGYGVNPEYFDDYPLMYGPILTEGAYVLHVAVPYSRKVGGEVLYARVSSKIIVNPQTAEEERAISELPKWWQDFKTDHVKDTIQARNYIMGVIRNKNIHSAVKYRILERTSWMRKYYDSESAEEIIDTLLTMPFTELQRDAISILLEGNPHSNAIMKRMLHALPYKEIDPRNKKWLEQYAKKMAQDK